LLVRTEGVAAAFHRKQYDPGGRDGFLATLSAGEMGKPGDAGTIRYQTAPERQCRCRHTRAFGAQTGEELWFAIGDDSFPEAARLHERGGYDRAVRERDANQDYRYPRRQPGE
jgi:hypothetical protein